MDYIAYLHKDRISDFGVSFPDFPGCVTAGKTLEEARRLAGDSHQSAKRHVPLSASGRRRSSFLTRSR